MSEARRKGCEMMETKNKKWNKLMNGGLDEHTNRVWKQIHGQLYR